MSTPLSVLMLGDLVGQAGLRKVFFGLKDLRKKYKAHMVVLNAENAAEGYGLQREAMEKLFASGVDVITSGNHIWQKSEIFDSLNTQAYLLRPLNYPSELPGKGFCIWQANNGESIAVVNLQGIHSGMPLLENPLLALRKILPQLKQKTSKILIDFHAESPREKEILAWALDGQISALVGTHTHVPTADETILPLGTAYVTDLGMTGVLDSIIGFETKTSLIRYRTAVYEKNIPAEGEASFCGVHFLLDGQTGKALSIQRIE